MWPWSLLAALLFLVIAQIGSPVCRGKGKEVKGEGRRVTTDISASSSLSNDASRPRRHPCCGFARYQAC